MRGYSHKQSSLYRFLPPIIHTLQFDCLNIRPLTSEGIWRTTPSLATHTFTVLCVALMELVIVLDTMWHHARASQGLQLFDHIDKLVVYNARTISDNYGNWEMFYIDISLSRKCHADIEVWQYNAQDQRVCQCLDTCNMLFFVCLCVWCVCVCVCVCVCGVCACVACVRVCLSVCLCHNCCV